MKILTVCSGLDFINYTRRASIEAIHKLNPEMDVLLFNSILNIRKNKNIPSHIRFYNYHFWILERLRKFKILTSFEHIVRSIKWKSFFNRYEVVFFIDPNQYYLLQYLNRDHKLIYLLRDPSILLNPDSYYYELPIINRANAILGISNNLCSTYFEKYYGFFPANIHLWPNTVDTDLWNYKHWRKYIKQKSRPLIGLAGNIDYVIDIELLNYIATKLSDCDFEFAGKLKLDNNEQQQFQQLIQLPNVRHMGFIPYNEFPAIVINWDIGLVAAKPDHEFAHYLNNNKQYQYIALGKPFVTYRFNADYNEFEDMVFIATDRDDFIQKIRMALSKSKDQDLINKGKKIARKQSAYIRAIQFLDIIKNV